jgi:hypothetical protein
VALSLRGGATRGPRERVRAGNTPRGRRGDEHAHALGSVAVGAPADGINIVPTRCADSAGASSMIESVSISVSDAARGDNTSAVGGSCPDEAAVVLVVAAMAVIIRPEPSALHSMVSGSSSAPTGPQSRGRPRPAHKHRLRAAWDKRESADVTAAADHRDLGVDVVPAGRGRYVKGAVAVEPDRSQLRLPAPGEQRASCQQNRRGGAFARADGEHKLSRAEAGAPLGGHIVGAGAGADGARACVRARVCTCIMRSGQRKGRPKAARRGARARCMRGCRQGWGAHLRWVGVPGLEEIGDNVDRGVGRLARALVPRRARARGCARMGVVRAEWSVWRCCCVVC